MELSPRRIVVTHKLPLDAKPDPASPFGFAFALNGNALPHQLGQGLPGPVIFVGTLPEAAAVAERSDELAGHLLASFSCLPVFLTPRVHSQFYDGFCKHYLWHLLHYLQLPHTTSTFGDLHFSAELYRAYMAANKSFAESVREVLDDGDLVFVHDYHLWLVPSFLRRECPKSKVAFFLHSPFPSAEVFRSIPVREDLLRGLLNADLVGFQTYGYAHHFRSVCSRLLGVNYCSRNGRTGIDYYGRTVLIKILAVGLDMGQVRAAIAAPAAAAKFREIVEEYGGRTLVVGVDDVDLFKGVNLKLLALERLFETRPEVRGQLVLVQIHNPARCRGSDVDGVREEVERIRARINARFGWPAAAYQPVVVIERAVPMAEKVAYYAAAECCVVSAVRDGLNRIPFFYTVCRQEGPVVNGAAPRTSAVVLSEFAGCSPSLSGAILVNPWNVEGAAESMYAALTMNAGHKHARHMAHYDYLTTHDVVHWTTSLDADLRLVCNDRSTMRTFGMGFGMSYRVVAVDAAFKKLAPEFVAPAYHGAGSRLILLDYDGTLVPTGSLYNAPTDEVIAIINQLCSDPRNIVFLMSGRDKDELATWFAACDRLGISAEHGYFTRWRRDAPWETMPGRTAAAGMAWKEAAQQVMAYYTELTDGSYVEEKETAMVWHYQDADATLGPCQAKELLHHLATVLAREPVTVRSGCQVVEVNPQGVNKGVAAVGIVCAMAASNRGPPGFILCVGDDRCDEDMFEAVATIDKTNDASSSTSPLPPRVFACTVGNKPSMARYYLDDHEEVLAMLSGLASCSTSGSQSAAASVQFELKHLSICDDRE